VRVFTSDNPAWGFHIGWTEYPTKVYGHYTPQPEKGDRFEQKMKSGFIGVFEFEKVEYCRDPEDMFFADMKPLGYKHELEAEALATPEGQK
jgi:hypothetical protein